LRVLNAKKLRLIAVQQQLAELKRQRCDAAAVETSSSSAAEPANVARGRGKRGGGGTESIGPLRSVVDDGTTVKRQRATRNGTKRSIISFEEDERMEDDVPPLGPVEAVDESPSVPVDVDVFAADTQVDDVAADDSPPWFQEQRPVSPPKSVQPLQSLPANEDDVHQKSKHMTALDKLWSGIL